MSPFGLTLNQALSVPCMVMDTDINMNMHEEIESQTITTIAEEISLSPHSSQSPLAVLNLNTSSSQPLLTQSAASNHGAWTELFNNGTHGSSKSNTEPVSLQFVPSMLSSEVIFSRAARNPVMSQPKRSFFRTPVANQHQENTFIDGDDGDIIGARANKEQNSPSFNDQLNQTNRNMDQGLYPQTTEVPVPPFYRQGLRTLGLPNHIQNQISSHNSQHHHKPNSGNKRGPIFKPNPR